MTWLRGFVLLVFLGAISSTARAQSGVSLRYQGRGFSCSQGWSMGRGGFSSGFAYTTPSSGIASGTAVRPRQYSNGLYYDSGSFSDGQRYRIGPTYHRGGTFYRRY